jgi:hypothetical protein
MQSLNAWLVGHDMGLLLVGADPDGAPLVDGVVVSQDPVPGALRDQWDVVIVWVRVDPGEPSGVREPGRRPPSFSSDAVEQEIADNGN